MKIFKLFLFIAILSSINIYSNICKSIYSFNEIKEILDNTTDKSLVVFDIDDVLIMAEDKILQKKYRISNFRQHIESKFKINEAHQSIIMLQSNKKIIEPEILKIIDDLQKRKVKVMGLTYLESGSYGLIDSLLKWRFNDLSKLGINLNKNFEFNNLVFKALTPHNNNYPAFYNGVNCTNLHDKGIVLTEFIKFLNYIPDQVIFFDDRIENVRSVFDHMDKLKIPVYSYHYLGEEIVGNKENEPNEEEKIIAEKQFKYLSKNSKWISDKEASRLQKIK